MRRIAFALLLVMYLNAGRLAMSPVAIRPDGFLTWPPFYGAAVRPGSLLSQASGA